MDIDDTITSNPAFFAELTARWAARKGEVHIVTTRSAESRNDTTAELRGHQVRYDFLHFLPPMTQSSGDAAPSDLDWYLRYLYGKVAYCLAHKIHYMVDDDPKVRQLLARYAPKIVAVHPSQRDVIESWSASAAP